MSFTKQQQQKFAHMIRIEIPDEKMADMDVNQVFNWLERMKKIDTTGIDPMFTPARHPAPLRDDVITVDNIRDEILTNAPDDAGKSSGFFAVPKMIDED